MICVYKAFKIQKITIKYILKKIKYIIYNKFKIWTLKRIESGQIQ